MKRAIRLKTLLNSPSQSPKYLIRRSSQWTEDRVIRSPYTEIELPNMTLNDYIWQNLDKYPEKTLSVCSETGRGYTYEQAFNLSNAFAANLRLKLKIKDGDVVSVMLPNLPDYPLIALGILEAGGIISTINPLYKAYEVKKQLIMSDAKVIVTIPGLINTVKDAMRSAKIDLPIITVKTYEGPTPENTYCFNELSEDIHVDKSCLKKVRRTPKDICFLPYSSGTTGMPKAVLLTHRNILTNLLQFNVPEIIHHKETTATQQSSVLGLLPFFHIYGATAIVFHKMSVGAKIITTTKFQPETFLNDLKRFKIDILYAAPPIILYMGKHAASTPETYRNLDTVINGAAPLEVSDVERFLSKVDKELDFRQAYGLTETSPLALMPPIGNKDYKAVGFPVSNTEVKIVDPNLNALGPNQSGELLIKGSQVMLGYKDNPKANSEVFVDGWFRTGDIATAKDNGQISITDRLKELIKVKGFQVAPAELEALLRDHPDVNDAAVVGVPHPVKGEAPKAFIVLKPGIKTDTKTITEYVNDKVAEFKRIEQIDIIDIIPKSLAGKILRRELK